MAKSKTLLLFVTLLCIASTWSVTPPKRSHDVRKYLEGQTLCPAHPLAVPLPRPLPQVLQDAFSNFEQTMQSLLTNVSVNGATCMFAGVTYGDDILWSGGVGTKNKSVDIPPDADTIFKIGSVTKVFPVVMLYQLQEQGIVSLDDLLVTYEPDFQMKNPFLPGSLGPTLRQMASQLSGLPRNAPCEGICNLTTSDILPRLVNMSLILPPYTRPSYSNLGYALLGRVLASHIGVEFEDYIQDAILDPLGMVDTGFKYTEEVVERMAVGYGFDGSVAPLTDIGWQAPAGQMYSTGNDMFTFLQVFLAAQNSGTPSIMLSSTINEMLSPIFLNNDGATLFGAPWEMFFENSYLIRTKAGNSAGYSALIAVIPDLQVGFVVLVNGYMDDDAVALALLNPLIPAFVEALLPIQPPVAGPPNPSAFLGTFIPDQFQDSYVEIAQYKGSLVSVFHLGDTSFTVFLRWNYENNFSIFIPDGFLPCLEEEFEAANFEEVIFSLDQNGTAVSFTLPGFYYGVLFSKQ